MQKNDTTKSDSFLRHAEYYEMQNTFDDLYERAKNGEVFEDLMSIILSPQNILLAYRNIKTNKGSYTPGTDKLTIEDIGNLPPEEVIEKIQYIVAGSNHGYRPKPVRRKEIPKPNGEMRPLGIPCIWDRLVQQCVKQVMEPICEAKFSEHSYGFRPNRSVENAIAEIYSRLQLNKLHYVIEFDIKGFFDNVNHQKLIRQIWALGIRDKHLMFVIRKMLKAPVKMADGSIIYPTKGTPQGGIISPLLANIVLNELDHWVESNWENNPVVYKYAVGKNKAGIEIKSAGYKAMRKTNLKEMFIVRYADDFRICCRTKTAAILTKIAITKWLKERLNLEVNEEKTRVVNVKRQYSEFLGFKVKVRKKGEKHTVTSHVSNKQLKRTKRSLLQQVKRIAHPRPEYAEHGEIKLFNAMVIGMQNYYRIATEINRDYNPINRSVMQVLINRLHGSRMKRDGRALTKFEMERFGSTAMLRFAACEEPIYPIGYVQCKNPMHKKRSTCIYTREGRQELHDNLRINTQMMTDLMKQPSYGRSLEYMDNRIALFCAQNGRCSVTGETFSSVEGIHCHHKKPRAEGGTDKYENLTLVEKDIHHLIHAKNRKIIEKYLNQYDLNSAQKEKLNKFRILAGKAPIA